MPKEIIHKTGGVLTSLAAFVTVVSGITISESLAAERKILRKRLFKQPLTLFNQTVSGVGFCA